MMIVSDSKVIGKHTPGPWFLGKSGFIQQVQIQSKDGPLGVVYGTSGENSANANLISAAPDLLEALEDLKRELILSDVDMDYIESHFRPWINKAELAVAKARDYLFSPNTEIDKAKGLAQ